MQRFNKQGFGEADYRKLIEANLLRDKLNDAITGDVLPVQTQVWARHILVSDEAIALATIDRIKAGEDFGALAKEISQDTGSGTLGGDLGWFGKGQMVAPFEQAAFSLEPGVISAPVKSDFGWHIIQVIARQERPLTNSEYQQARDQAFSDWLTTARDVYGVETSDFWKERVPTEPNFITQATEQAQQFQTANAEAGKEPAGTPTPASQ
jgi:parvulin-like peptidyl-prolyl isomerase